MRLGEYFVKNSSLKYIGLNRFVYWGNMLGSLVSPAVPSIYIVLVKEGFGYFNQKKFKAGDVFAYGFNMRPLAADTYNLSFLGIDMEFHLFYQLTGILPADCNDVLMLDSSTIFYQLVNQVIEQPLEHWIPKIESVVLNYLSHSHKPFDPKTERLIYATRSIQQLNFAGFDQLASHQLGISYRALQRDFASLLGITPKQYQSLNRLYLASEYIKNRKLGEVAFLAGYSDQSHMNREFKRFAGITPYQVNLSHKTDSKYYLSHCTQSAKNSGFILPY